MFVLVLLYSTLCPFLFCSHLGGEERAGCFTLFVYLMSCDCCCSVALRHRVVGWAVVCNCGIY